MALQTFKVKVVENSVLASKFRYVDFELIEPSRIEFQAGQYVMVKIPGEERLRQYSIVSSPSMNHGVELLVDVSPGGAASKYLASLKPGDEAEVMGPAGQFIVKSTTSTTGSASSGGSREEQLIFVATGSGIAPIKSMIDDLLIDKNDARRMWLHWGLRSPEDMFWFDDLAKMAEEHDNFTFDMVLSQPPEGWELCQGHVTECVLKHHTDLTNTGIYLCGNKEMIEEVRQKLLEKGISFDMIHNEKFT